MRVPGVIRNYLTEQADIRTLDAGVERIFWQWLSGWGTRWERADAAVERCNQAIISLKFSQPARAGRLDAASMQAAKKFDQVLFEVVSYRNDVRRF